MAVIEYTRPTGWSDLEMDWSNPDLRLFKYLDALIQAVNERCDDPPFTPLFYYFNNMKSGPFAYLKFNMLELLHKKVMELIPGYVNHLSLTLGKIKNWTVNEILNTLSLDAVVLPSRYSLDNSDWAKFMYGVMNLLLYKSVPVSTWGWFYDITGNHWSIDTYGTTAQESANKVYERISYAGHYNLTSMSQGDHIIGLVYWINENSSNPDWRAYWEGSCAIRAPFFNISNPGRGSFKSKCQFWLEIEQQNPDFHVDVAPYVDGLNLIEEITFSETDNVHTVDFPVELYDLRFDFSSLPTPVLADMSPGMPGMYFYHTGGGIAYNGYLLMQPEYNFINTGE